MLRAEKSGLERLGEIPPCRIVSTPIILSPAERRAYNGLVCIIRRNLTLSGCGGSTVDSLLHPKNRKYALEALSNARKACCVSGQFRIEIVRAHLEESIAELVRGHSLHHPACRCDGPYYDIPKARVFQYLGRGGRCPLLAPLEDGGGRGNDGAGAAGSGGELGLEARAPAVGEELIRAVRDAFLGCAGSAGERATVDRDAARCGSCGQNSIFPYVTPCGHLGCEACVAGAFRPPLDLDRPPTSADKPRFADKLRAAAAAAAGGDCGQAVMVCPVCGTEHDVDRFVLFQPSVEQSGVEWDSRWIEHVSSKVGLLLVRLRSLGFFGRRLINENWWRSTVIPAAAPSLPHRALGVGGAQAATTVAVAAGSMENGTKCIVFSNFIEVIDSVANSISEALCGEGCFMRFTANMRGGMTERVSALAHFRDDASTTVLLIDGVGALGLDLSFVSHVFLIDPIWDPALEAQVISRAHRLGAKRAILVEKLVAEGTVEQTMEQLARQPTADTTGDPSDSVPDPSAVDGEIDEGGHNSGDAAKGKATGRGGTAARVERERRKIRSLLKSLSFLPHDDLDEPDHPAPNPADVNAPPFVDTSAMDASAAEAENSLPLFSRRRGASSGGGNTPTLPSASRIEGRRQPHRRREAEDGANNNDGGQAGEAAAEQSASVRVKRVHFA